MIAIILGLFITIAMIERRSILALLVISIVCICVAIYDSFQIKHSILRNFPLIGRLRFLFELIRPEIRQYFIAGNQEETPFDRETRSIVYQRAKCALDTQPFGTQQRIVFPGYVSARHSLKPTVLTENDGRIVVGGPQCSKPYQASRLNVSALSYGALSQNAILALNKGAKVGGFSHNTGEGGLSPYHLQNGGDLVWQLGTAMFGCCTHEGRFDPVLFREKAAAEQIKMIEIKLSQGEKHSHGGILPAVKVTPEIAEIRGIPLGRDCISPPTNPEFSTPEEMMHFIAKVRELANGKPVGFKLCIGIRYQFLGICKAILKTGIIPDFITVDGAEGGTGAAPLEFSDHIGEPLNEALIFVHNALTGTGLRDKIRVIASGKVATGFDMIHKLSIGADMCNSARAMMFALGCVQSLQCNKNTCPTGVTTQNPRLMRGLVVEDKYIRVANFQKATIHSFLELCGAMGVHSPDELSPWKLFQRTPQGVTKPFAEIYTFLEKNVLLLQPEVTHLNHEWEVASAESF
ncbi:MAG: FMN-binding glutamate synthase family protein [Legionellales bacterium]|nr:FMN-binding glutamate synthase family protein [Legionellales bacterium]